MAITASWGQAGMVRGKNDMSVLCPTGASWCVIDMQTCSFNHGSLYFIISVPHIFYHSDFDLILGCSFRFRCATSRSYLISNAVFHLNLNKLPRYISMTQVVAVV